MLRPDLQPAAHEVGIHHPAIAGACLGADGAGAGRTTPEAGLQDAIGQMERSGRPHLLVMDGGRLVGFLTRSDVARRIEILGLAKGADDTA